MAKKSWDLTSAHSLEGAAGWIGKNAGASLVLVVRPKDVAVWIDDKLQPYEAITAIRNELPQLLQHLIDVRAGKVQKKKAPANPDAEDPA
jgi:hypothetical protein